MTKDKFKRIIGYFDPLMCVQGNIFETPANHIAFAVHYPNGKGEFKNCTGFAGDVCSYAWPELKDIKFEKGEVRSHEYCGKTYHAMAVHSNELGGWDKAPEFIELCLNKIPVNDKEVIATVLIGGGEAGKKWKANPKNIIGMARSYKTIVLYVQELQYMKVLAAMGITSQNINSYERLLFDEKIYTALVA